MKLLLTVSVVLCVFVVMASSAAISPERNENINTAVDKLDEKPLLPNAVSRQTFFSPDSTVCLPQGQYCGSSRPSGRGGDPPCCRGLSCISRKCEPQPCVPQNSRCGWGGTTCCGSLQCIQRVCQLPQPPAPTPRPTCSTRHCGPSHPACCGLNHCRHGTCVHSHVFPGIGGRQPL